MKRADIEHVLRALGSTEFRYSGDWVMTNCPLARWTHSKGRIQDRHSVFRLHEGFHQLIALHAA